MSHSVKLMMCIVNDLITVANVRLDYTEELMWLVCGVAYTQVVVDHIVMNSDRIQLSRSQCFMRQHGFLHAEYRNT
jgi:hypothetical protein